MSSTITARRGLVTAIILFAGVGLASTAALADVKVTSKWNSSSFAAACNRSANCLGAKLPSGDYQAEIPDGYWLAKIRCSAHHCAYQLTEIVLPGKKPDKPSKQSSLEDMLSKKKR